jgi:hypothetical protein
MLVLHWATNPSHKETDIGNNKNSNVVNFSWY